MKLLLLIASFIALVGCETTMVITKPTGETVEMSESTFVAMEVADLKKDCYATLRSPAVPPIAPAGLEPVAQAIWANGQSIAAVMNAQRDPCAGAGKEMTELAINSINQKYAFARQGLSLFGWLAGGLIIADAIKDISSSSGSTYNLTSTDQASISDVNIASGKSSVGTDGATIRNMSNDNVNTSAGAQGFGGSSVGNSASASDSGSASFGGISEEAPLAF